MSIIIAINIVVMVLMIVVVLVLMGGGGFCMRRGTSVLLGKEIGVLVGGGLSHRECHLRVSPLGESASPTLVPFG